jgi:cyclase
MGRWPCVVPTGAERTRYDEVPAYAEGLYDLGQGLYAWLVPNGSWGESNSGLIVGRGEALLVDTQWDVAHTRQMLAAVERTLAGLPIRYVVNTHSDGDHCWGNDLLPGAEIVASEAAGEEMKALRPASLRLLGALSRALCHIPILGTDRVGRWVRGWLSPYDFRGVRRRLPSRRFGGSETLEVGGRTVELIEVGPAHTEGDAMVYVPDAKVLYAGDVVFLGSTPVTWAGSIADCLKVLDRILAMDVEVVVPGHGPLTDKSGVRQARVYWEFVQAETSRRREAGVSAGQAARQIALSSEFARQPFASWDSPERIAINTHAEYRHQAGRTGHLGTLEMLRVVRRMALLAYLLPEAEPRSLRQSERPKE